MNIVDVQSAAELVDHLDGWEDLATDSLETNVFYEPWLLHAAVKAFGADTALTFVLVYDHTDIQPRLCGFFPFTVQRGYKKLPITVLRFWQHLHCFLNTPLIRTGYAHSCFTELFDWLRQQHYANLVEWNDIALDGPMYSALKEIALQRNVRLHAVDSFERALLTPSDSGDSYIDASLSTGNRKELRRQLRRLGDLGTVTWRTLQPDDDVDTWCADFLALEALGWKGHNGTALQTNQTELAYFTQICQKAFARQQLMMLQLQLDGRPIAMKCNFLSGDGAFAFKIAFDERYAKYSPGCQLELENIRRVHDIPALAWMDSCAARDHFMINRLWQKRRTIGTVLSDTGTLSSRLLSKSLMAAKRLHHQWRSLRTARNGNNK